ncbi:tRNA-binding protein [Pontibacillus halophilus JSM 076056 = DSM 19796]|uniref:tRNA-binding protein n=1 Tax=Pontibacillus halophilus JSM 076056 = DSM 19796 TaxID=1385510 RepID=A0A0A5I0N3_9BACI|nr:DUF4479 family protein [Pontibacillus halophilus]KGX89407.1 tRNA-binding protein [Pontibacillus halophilus JSM 076056 = DSM 19796]
MNAYYNLQGIGDVLIVSLTKGTRADLAVEKQGDVARTYHETTGETFGFNIFRASEYFSIKEEQGAISLDQNWVDQINDVLQKNNIQHSVEADFSPKFVVGYVKEKAQHENADKLSVCQVDVGEEVVQIVCGAPNVDAGQHVVVAKVGAVMPSGMEIKATELRGVPSHGMICSAKELDLPDAPKEKGILVLEGERNPGETFFQA